MTDITLRWSGPSDAAAGSTYKIEQTLDNDTWTELAAAQAATSPYVSPASTLASDHAYGATSVVLASGTSFSSAGYGWIDDALIQWTGKSSNTLTGVTWHSGYGTYASGTAVTEAHESYSDAGVTISDNAVLYRITHIDADGNESAPLHSWYYHPPKPASSQHCVVVVAVGADLGVDMQSGVNVQAYLASDNQFGAHAGQHLDSNVLTGNNQTTNDFGLAFFHCWRDSARVGLGGAADVPYVFVLKPGSGQLEVTVSSVPDRDWVLLSQVAD